MRTKNDPHGSKLMSFVSLRASWSDALELPPEDRKTLFAITLNKLEQGTGGASQISTANIGEGTGFDFYFSVNKSLADIELVLNELKREVEAAGLGTQEHILDRGLPNDQIIKRVIAVDKKEVLDKQKPWRLGRSDFEALYRGTVAAIAGVSALGIASYIVLAPNYHPAFLAVFGTLAVFNGLMSAVIGKKIVPDYRQAKREEIAYTKSSPSTSFVTLYASDIPYGHRIEKRSFRDMESRERFMRLHEE